MLDLFRSTPKWEDFGGEKKANNKQLNKLFEGGSTIPYGNLVDGLRWKYSDWQTVTYEKKDCYWMNGEEWIGKEPKTPRFDT
jgi:hypothetical protein